MLGFVLLAQPILHDYMTERTKRFCAGLNIGRRKTRIKLAEVAREIDARRTGVYVLSDGERRALDEAKRSGIVSDDEVAAFWKRHSVGSWDGLSVSRTRHGVAARQCP